MADPQVQVLKEGILREISRQYTYARADGDVQARIQADETILRLQVLLSDADDVGDAEPDEESIDPHQHCTSEECQITYSHTALHCNFEQPRRCGCAFCYGG